MFFSFKKKEESKKIVEKGDALKSSEDSDSDPNFIKKDEKQEKKDDDLTSESAEEIGDVIDALKKTSPAVRPESNQQRNLDRENGGLEEGEDVQQSDSPDVWDGRSEEVDEMGSHVPLASSAKKSMIWGVKKKKLEEKKMKQSADALAAAKHAKKHSEKGFNSAAPQAGGYVSRLKALRQDRGNEGNDHGGGAYR